MTLIERLTALSGFGEQKVRTSAVLVGKQLGFQPQGWRAATSSFAKEGWDTSGGRPSPA